MRENLIQYVNLLFAGNVEKEELRQEILQNTLDRYDDLISQGNTPEEAYRMAVSGIGDTSVLLGTAFEPGYAPQYNQAPGMDAESTLETMGLNLNRIMRAIAIGLYIISIVPVIALSEVNLEVLGVCMTLVIVAIATVLLLVFRKKKPAEEPVKPESPMTEKDNLYASMDKAISSVGIVLYFILSFLTGAWGITWVIFLMIPAVKSLVHAYFDLKGRF